MIEQPRFSVLSGGGSSLPSQKSVRCFEVLVGGLETTVQDCMGREGLLQMGVPRSGPMDCPSFQLGNELLGNDWTAAGLEIQFIGPKLRFFAETRIVITGADNHPQVNQKPIPLWQTVQVQPGDILSFGHPEIGARTYVTFAGGLDVPLVLGSRSTFIRAGMGGFQGRKLMPGDVLHTFWVPTQLRQSRPRSLPPDQIPEFTSHWEVEVLAGPHDDWLTQADIDHFLNHEWTVSSQSDRIGYRLIGDPFNFSENASLKSPENGGHPSNKVDYGCPMGSILFCGHTPTVLLVDGPSLTGYMTPFTVIEDSLRKVGQARPGDRVRFKLVTLSSALERLPIVPG